MFLRATTRKKDGKTHRYWSVVENRRRADGRVLQRHVLYPGEINDSQARAWRRSIEVLDEREDGPRTVALFPEERIDECMSDTSVVRLRLSQLRLCQPHVWGSCWLALKLWERLELDRLWSRRLPRNGSRRPRSLEGPRRLRTRQGQPQPPRPPGRPGQRRPVPGHAATPAPAGAGLARRRAAADAAHAGGGYDHSYYFIQTFMGEHVAHHAEGC